MAKVRIEVVTFEPGAQMVTGGVIQSQTITINATSAASVPIGGINLGDNTKTEGVYGNMLSGHFIAYIRVLEGTIAWRKDAKVPNSDPKRMPDNTAMPPDPGNPLEEVPSIVRTENHDAIPVRVYRGDVFTFLDVTP